MAEDSRSNVPYGAFTALIIFLAGILALILRSRRWPTYGVHLPPSTVNEDKTPVRAILLPETMPTGTLPAPDDLTVIEGIGPKIAAVLKAAGIHRLEQLAKAAPDELKRLLTAAGNRIANPATWPEQAKLAAAGKYDALRALQAKLRAGRRTA
ncbi:MAG: helix-hairpin-helix domain-containing protein [Bellilinea sp.]